MAIKIKGVGEINIIDDKIEITKISGTDGTKASKVTLTDDKIEVDALTVNLGSKPTAGVVNSLSGVPGSYSFDFVTGQPIPSSQSVKTDPQ